MNGSHVMIEFGLFQDMALAPSLGVYIISHDRDPC